MVLMSAGVSASLTAPHSTMPPNFCIFFLWVERKNHYNACTVNRLYVENGTVSSKDKNERLKSAHDVALFPQQTQSLSPVANSATEDQLKPPFPLSTLPVDPTGQSLLASLPPTLADTPINHRPLLPEDQAGCLWTFSSLSLPP